MFHPNSEGTFGALPTDTQIMFSLSFLLTK